MDQVNNSEVNECETKEIFVARNNLVKKIQDLRVSARDVENYQTLKEYKRTIRNLEKILDKMPDSCTE